nr:HPr family phosphocarrier protein [Caldicoprobacter guelmensis]
MEARFTIEHQAGLQARPAALFVQVASRFVSRIWVVKGLKKVNAKSIMGVMSLGIKQGDEVTIIVEGEDESKAMSAIQRLIASNFSEVPHNSASS